MICKGNLDEFKDRIHYLTSCCLHPSEPVIPDSVLAWNEGCDCWPENCGGKSCFASGWELAVYTQGGKYFVLFAWEDTSGHGCRCGTQVSIPYDTLFQALSVGLDEEEKKKLEVVPELSDEQKAHLRTMKDLLDAGTDPSDPSIVECLVSAGLVKGEESNP